MRHLKRNPRFDQRLIPTERVIFDLRSSVVAAVEPRSLLRINKCHTRKRCFVAQVALELVGPAVDLLHAFQPARVMKHAAEFAEPRAHAVSDPVEHPDANFGIVLNAVFPPVRFLEADAKQSGDRFAPHRGAVFLSIFSICPRSGNTTPRLAIRGEHRRQFADLPHIERT